MELLKTLCLTPSVSANENEIANIICKTLKDYVDEIKIDNIGNVIAHKKGTGKKIMFCTPSDECGGVVSFIEENGNIRFSKIGNIKPQNMLNGRVLLKNSTLGIIKSDNTNLSELKFSDLYIDIGAKNRSEAEKNVEISDAFCMDLTYFENETYVFTSAGGGKFGVYALCETAKSIKTENDLYFVFATRSQIGHKGAKTAALSVDADYIVSVDTAEAKNIKADGKVIINIKDSSFIADKNLIAKTENILSNSKNDYILAVDLKKTSQAGVMWEASAKNILEIYFQVTYEDEIYKKVCKDNIEAIKNAVCIIGEM